MPDPRAVAVFTISFAAMSFAAAIGLGVAGYVATHSQVSDPCELPRGIQLGALGERDRSLALRHAIACGDLYHGRITVDEYREAMRPPPPPAAPLVMQWASAVREASSQYGETSYSASRALGPPDVFPQSGDQVNAWASREADGGPEVLELAFDGQRRASAVELYETFNPGAVTHVEVVTADGQRHAVYQASAAPMSQPAFRRRIELACTDAPVVAVRVTLDSAAVPGWNEIDAVGLQPCE